MKALICDNCGASDFEKRNGLWYCKYCGTSFENDTKKESDISLNDDVKRLLEKCKAEPFNARKYANLILDIDPSNTEALKYL